MKCVNCSARIFLKILATKCGHAGWNWIKGIFLVNDLSFVKKEHRFTIAPYGG